jgi:hypothetical protein
MEMVEYKIVRFTSNNQIEGLLCHRKFSARFEEVLSGKIYEKRNSGGT